MSPRSPMDGSCTEVQEELRERWFLRTLSREPERESTPVDPFHQHMEACAECRAEADDMLLLEASLEQSFRLLGERAGDLEESRVEETVRRLRDGSQDAELIRKVRRPIRFLLWTAFYLFTLLASLTLAVAVIKALKG